MVFSRGWRVFQEVSGDSRSLLKVFQGGSEDFVIFQIISEGRRGILRSSGTSRSISMVFLGFKRHFKELWRSSRRFQDYSSS